MVMHSEAINAALSDAERPVIYVCGLHPIVQYCVVRWLEAVPGLHSRVVNVRCVPHSLLTRTSVVVLDLYSIPNWKSALRHWITLRARPIVILDQSTSRIAEPLRLVQLGICGIVTVSDALGGQIASAVKSVADGRLWLNEDLLEQYVIQRNEAAQKPTEGREGLTGRELQIFELLLREYTNRQIGQVLNISERTVKYHVHNILQKTNVGTRRDLLTASDS